MRRPGSPGCRRGSRRPRTSPSPSQGHHRRGRSKASGGGSHPAGARAAGPGTGSGPAMLPPGRYTAPHPPRCCYTRPRAAAQRSRATCPPWNDLEGSSRPPAGRPRPRCAGRRAGWRGRCRTASAAAATRSPPRPRAPRLRSAPRPAAGRGSTRSVQRCMAVASSRPQHAVVGSPASTTSGVIRFAAAVACAWLVGRVGLEPTTGGL